MVYLLFLAFVVLYFSSINCRTKRFSELIVRSIPVILFWVLLIGGQDNVGTDYYNYLSYFSNANNMGYILARGDYAFTSFVIICNSIGLYGQDVFFIHSFLCFLILLYIFKECYQGKLNFLNIVFFIFVVYSTAFNNQMNGLRQYTAIYLITCSFCLGMKRKYLLAILFLVIAIFTHKSSIITSAVFLLFLLLLNGRNFSEKWMYFSVIFGFMMSLFFHMGNMGLLVEYVRQYGLFGDYLIYYDQAHSTGATAMDNLTKYIYIPIYFLAIKNLHKMNITNTHKIYFTVGILSFAFKMSILSIPYLCRLGDFFLITMCIPIVYLMIYYSEKKLYVNNVILSFYFLLPYALKVTIWAVREYSYSSVFFK